MSFGEVAAAAIRYARDGFAVHTVMATFLQDKAEDYRRWPQNVAIWQRDGKPLGEGDRLVQADLGRTIQFMADQEKAAAGRAAMPAWRRRATPSIAATLPRRSRSTTAITAGC